MNETLIWKCQQCPNTVEKVWFPASGEAAFRDGVFNVPAGWTRLERSDVFFVFCSWTCLQTFAALWKDITDQPAVPDTRPRCGGAPGQPDVMPKEEGVRTRWMCPGCPDCVPDTHSRDDAALMFAAFANKWLPTRGLAESTTELGALIEQVRGETRAESAAALQEARDGCAAALVSEQRLLAEVAALRAALKELLDEEMRGPVDRAFWLGVRMGYQGQSTDLKVPSVLRGIALGSIAREETTDA